MTEPGREQALIDATVPSAPRVRDYLLGGKDNFAADRALGDRLADPAGGLPEIRQMVQEGRSFALAAVRWAAAQGVRQVISLGCGLPARPAIHDAAREGDPRTAVVYVDADPTVLCHIRALQATGPGLAAIGADPADPGKVLADRELRDIIRLDYPVCVVFGAVLHFLPAGLARSVVARYMAPLPPGSVAVMRAAWCADPDLAERLYEMFTPVTWHNHDAGTVASFFTAGGLRLAWGPVADVRTWLLQPIGNGRRASVIGGVGIKP